jgi:hypothetical protein
MIGRGYDQRADLTNRFIKATTGLASGTKVLPMFPANFYLCFRLLTAMN